MDKITEAVKRLLKAEDALHTMYVSTSTHYGGVGGQAMTLHCSITCHDPIHHAEVDEYNQARYELAQLVKEI